MFLPRRRAYLSIRFPQRQACVSARFQCGRWRCGRLPPCSPKRWGRRASAICLSASAASEIGEHQRHDRQQDRRAERDKPNQWPSGDSASSSAAASAPSEVATSAGCGRLVQAGAARADEEDDENLRRHRFDEPGGAEQVSAAAPKPCSKITKVAMSNSDDERPHDQREAQQIRHSQRMRLREVVAASTRSNGMPDLAEIVEQIVEQNLDRRQRQERE